MVSVAQMQGHLMLYRHDPFAAVKTADFSTQAAASAVPEHDAEVEPHNEGADAVDTRPSESTPSAEAERRSRRVHRRRPESGGGDGAEQY